MSPGPMRAAVPHELVAGAELDARWVLGECRELRGGAGAEATP